MRLLRAAACALSLGTACAAAPPDVPDPEPMTGSGALKGYADTVMAVTRGLDVTTCVESLPTCDGVEAGGTCLPNPALGAPDGMTFALNPGDVIELGFRCAAIVEKGSPGGAVTSELKLWGSVEGAAQGASIVIEVSYDGTRYQRLDFWTKPDQAFDLYRIPLEVARFVRVANQGSTVAHLDAREAL